MNFVILQRREEDMLQEVMVRFSVRWIHRNLNDGILETSMIIDTPQLGLLRLATRLHSVLQVLQFRAQYQAKIYAIVLALPIHFLSRSP
jgi:hypothetical protein